MSGPLDTLEALAGRLSDLEAVSGAAVHTSNGRPWIEVVVDDSMIGPPVLREIADHHCGISDVWLAAMSTSWLAHRRCTANGSSRN